MKLITTIIGLACFAIFVLGLSSLYVMGWQVAIKNNFGAIDVLLLTLIHGGLFMLIVYIDSVNRDSK